MFRTKTAYTAVADNLAALATVEAGDVAAARRALRKRMKGYPRALEAWQKTGQRVMREDDRRMEVQRGRN